jgi:PTS system nitrogen regulatory IIA component
MDLSSLLKPQAVRVLSDISSKKRLLQSIADTAEGLIGLPMTRSSMRLQERESLGPTGVGHGVALPHARLSALTAVHGAFLRLEKPVDFDSADRHPVDLVFALFAPTIPVSITSRRWRWCRARCAIRRCAPSCGPTAIRRRSTPS